MLAKDQPDTDLQSRLRAWINREDLTAVVRATQLGRDQLSRYAAGLKMSTAAQRGIEATLIDLRDRGLL